MAVKKISISLDADIFERATRAAQVEGVPLSTWLSRAASEAADLAAAQAALAEYIEIYGEPDEPAMAETRERLNKAGVGQLETADEAAARMAALARLRGGFPADPERLAG